MRTQFLWLTSSTSFSTMCETTNSATPSATHSATRLDFFPGETRRDPSPSLAFFP